MSVAHLCVEPVTSGSDLQAANEIMIAKNAADLNTPLLGERIKKFV
jgi:hypothetical protein